MRRSVSVVAGAVVVVGASFATAYLATGRGPSHPASARAASFPGCTAGQLAQSGFRSGLAGITVYYTIVIKNMSSTTCTLPATPSLQLRAPTGSAMPTAVHQGVQTLSESQAVGSTGPALGPNQQASVTTAFAANPANPAGCPPAAGLNLGLSAGGSIQLHEPLAPCGGRLSVTPFRPGDSLPH